MSKIRHDPEPSVRTLSATYSDGFVLEAHAHSWGQLLHASSGVMHVETDSAAWIVPPERAVWLPANASHRLTMRGDVAMRTAYFADPPPSIGGRPPSETGIVAVTPLLRELLVHAAARGRLRSNDPHESRLAGLLVDLVGAASPIPLSLPMPRDPRAVRVARQVLRDPSRDRSKSGASLRTIERLFVAETGMTFGRWRQQARLLAALSLLGQGEPVTRVALDVGYASASAFIAMFRSVLGTTPSRFVARQA